MIIIEPACVKLLFHEYGSHYEDIIENPTNPVKLQIADNNKKNEQNQSQLIFG